MSVWRGGRHEIGNQFRISKLGKCRRHFGRYPNVGRFNVGRHQLLGLGLFRCRLQQPIQNPTRPDLINLKTLIPLLSTHYSPDLHQNCFAATPARRGRSSSLVRSSIVDPASSLILASSSKVSLSLSQLSPAVSLPPSPFSQLSPAVSLPPSPSLSALDLSHCSLSRSAL